MSHVLRAALPPEGSTMFKHPAYVRACAEHEEVDPMVLEGSASIALLRDHDGLHTVYGYTTVSAIRPKARSPNSPSLFAPVPASNPR